MRNNNSFFSRLVVLLTIVLSFSTSEVSAQIDKYKDYREIYRDTAYFEAPTQLQVVMDSILDPYRVVTNHFNRNWFVFATAGAHTFRGDYSNDGKFSGTVSPDFGIGVGKWFTPGVGLKVEFIRSNSRGYTEYMNGHYGDGDIMQTDDGTAYRKMKTNWWDISASAILNLSRLFLGYEGYGSAKRMNQFMLNLGIGGVHHMGYGHSHGSDNEWSGHAELQYSRFFDRRKRFSLDVKARGLFYQTNFDLEYGQADHAASKWDCNLGIDVGFTFYLDKQRKNGWSHGLTKVYQRDYSGREIVVVKVKELPTTYNTMTFYVFFPNNYSGRNDAPLVQGSVVNALDYLAGGIFTQKEYANLGETASRLANGSSLNGLQIKDLPTEPADRNFDINFVPRGYEMRNDVPMSLSLKPEDMSRFYKDAGFYYAPIYDGLHNWHYRIDDATLGQQLLSSENYLETATFGLNAHSGLETIRQYMEVKENDELVSFADVYAAMRTNQGYVSQFADAATVARIKNILNNCTITMIQAEGLATSQDNNSGDNAVNVGIERNTALSQNRASTVIAWLKENKRISNVASEIYQVENMRGIRTVTDTSTRGLNAKLNRCVRVRIHYINKHE